VVDSNEGGPTGYTSLCDPFIATPVKTFSFMPPALGDLTLRLQSFVPFGLSVLADCADGGSEMSCRFFTAPSAGVLTASVASDDDLTVFVRDGCGPIDGTGELTCANSTPGNGTEVATAALAAGQVVTVIVDGFTPTTRATSRSTSPSPREHRSETMRLIRVRRVSLI
jgi:hypothetical protein